MSNMSVEDILDELGGYGIVDLCKGKFSGAGSPHLKGVREFWQLEVRLPGYHTEQGTQAYIRVQGASIRELADEGYAAFEAWVFSPQFAEARARYEKQQSRMRERYNTAPDYMKQGNFDPIRPPGEDIPPIVWGETRGGFIGTLDRAPDL